LGESFQIHDRPSLTWGNLTRVNKMGQLKVLDPLNLEGSLPCVIRKVDQEGKGYEEEKGKYGFFLSIGGIKASCLEQIPKGEKSIISAGRVSWEKVLKGFKGKSGIRCSRGGVLSSQGVLSIPSSQRLLELVT